MREATTAPRSPLRISLRRFRRNTLALVCLAVVGLFAAACVVGPWLMEADYAEGDPADQYEEPSAEHWFGRDQNGRDLLVRCLVGGRISLAVGVVGTLVSVVIGVAYGSVAGYAGGRTDRAMMRFVDVLYSLPYILFVVLIMAMLGRDITPGQRIVAMFVALGAVQWLTMARIVRGEVVALKEKDFVEAARATGAGWRRIVFRHIVPNLAGVVIVYATLTVPMIMLQEAFLSFLGLGVQKPLPSWGSLIRMGADAMRAYPRLLIFPGLMFTTVLFALNFIGDGLRDAFDPQMQR
jgi:oligopeptide transport system permease protein